MRVREAWRSWAVYRNLQLTFKSWQFGSFKWLQKGTKLIRTDAEMIIFSERSIKIASSWGFCPHMRYFSSNRALLTKSWLLVYFHGTDTMALKANPHQLIGASGIFTRFKFLSDYTAWQIQPRCCLTDCRKASYPRLQQFDKDASWAIDLWIMWLS